ncbi:MAG: biopolymer transporter ExbD [Deltaproteobacteria bacterium]|nr:biopolymer transporter ExbD [Deltaproteobacteria bacterium]
MAGSAKGDDESLVTDINVTPLVDIMLCLLVIFMVTTTYVVADSIKIDLPNAASGETTTPSTIAIMFTKERKLFMNGEETTEPALRGKVREEVAKNKDTQAIIGADKVVSHGEVMHLIDIVKIEGITKFAINIESEE